MVMLVILMPFPTLEGLIVVVMLYHKSEEQSVTGGEKVRTSKEDSHQKDNAGAGGDVGIKGKKKSPDGAERSQDSAPPKHTGERICHEVGCGCWKDQEAE